ncbi:eukaryotic translation initiation factor 2-alpha kinase 3 [Pelomyxa schiedti]|nr:eukaryotic translation initiation factor 2-alpha kinase 3 [Pelomyxa schiedti]
MNKVDTCEYAVKKIRFRSHSSVRDKVYREVQTLAHLDHPNIVRYHNAWFEKSLDEEELDVKQNRYHALTEYHAYPFSSDSNESEFTVSSTADTVTSYSATPPLNGNSGHLVKPTAGKCDQITTLKTSAPLTSSGEGSRVSYPQSSESGYDKSGVDSDAGNFLHDSLPLFDDNSDQLRLAPPPCALERVVFESSSSGHPPKPTTDRSPSIPIPRHSNRHHHSCEHHCQHRHGWDTCVLYIQMHLYEATLDTWLRREGRKINRIENLDIFRQIVEAIKYLHSLCIIHRDIKPASNCFLFYYSFLVSADIFLSKRTESSSTSTYSVSVGDFGLATFAAQPMFSPHEDHLCASLSASLPAPPSAFLSPRNSNNGKIILNRTPCASGRNGLSSSSEFSIAPSSPSPTVSPTPTPRLSADYLGCSWGN